MIKRFVFGIVLAAVFASSGALVSCRLPEENGGDTAARVAAVEVPSGAARFGGADVSVNGTELPLFSVMVNNSHTWTANVTQRTPAGVGYFIKSGGYVDVVIRFESALSGEATVRPLSHGIAAVTDRAAGTVSFRLSEQGDYVIEPDGDVKRALFLFVYAEGGDYSEFTAGRNVIRFEKGLHDKDTNPLINASNTVSVPSNTTVILDEGAVVRAKFSATDKENITIAGRGVIDGSAFERNATTGRVTVPLDFSRCKNVTLKDFSVLDAAGWCVNFYFIEDSLIDGVKIFTSRSNGDGISLQSCKRIEAKNCFLRTWDDALVVKNYPVERYTDKHGATSGILFSNCLLWIDLAQAMEIGYETVGKQLENVTFKDITVLHAFHKPVISIHNANNAEIKNVTFEGITVEDASMGKGDAGWNVQLIDFRITFSDNWSTNHAITTLGGIDGVLVKDVNVLSGRGDVAIFMAGAFDSRYGTYHYVRNVTLQNVTVYGTKVDAEYPYINIESRTENIRFL